MHKHSEVLLGVLRYPPNTPSVGDHEVWSWAEYGVVIPSRITTNGNCWMVAQYIYDVCHYEGPEEVCRGIQWIPEPTIADASNVQRLRDSLLLAYKLHTQWLKGDVTNT